MAKITPVKAFPNPEILALRVSDRIQPALVVESRRIHDQCIAFPMADRVAHPRRLRIIGKLAAIRVYLPVRVTLFVEHRNHSWSLNDFERKIVIKVEPRNALRDAACR